MKEKPKLVLIYQKVKRVDETINGVLSSYPQKKKKEKRFKRCTYYFNSPNLKNIVCIKVAKMIYK
jgi:hypothetical protein